MKLRVREFAFRETICRTRMPFRFGKATLHEAPLLDFRIEADAEDGQRVVGRSASLLVPKWFEKDFAKTEEEDFDALRRSARAAAEGAVALDAGRAFDLWWELDRERVESLPVDAPNRLLEGFGVALVERALLDAACRAKRQTLSNGLRMRFLGFDPGRVSGTIRDWNARRALKPFPSSRVTVRHTIGFADPLVASDVPPEQRLDDGLPECLEEDVRHYGLRAFKIKLSGDGAADEQRLRAIAKVLRPLYREEATPFERFAGYDRALVTIDANESYEDTVALAETLERAVENRDVARLLSGLAAIEQPLPREHTFDPSRHRAMARLAAFAPGLIDEADTGLDAFRRAIPLGYLGVSFKSCKGVFRGLLHRAQIDCSDLPLFQTAEDLTNLPLLALQQDLAVVSSLWFDHVERNGHHYFRGLDHLPPGLARAAQAAHPDVYETFGEGATLRIERGGLALNSLNVEGFGYGVDDWA